MTTLKEQRNTLTVAVAGALGSAPTFTYWPANVTAPCAVVEMGRGTHRKARHWETQWHVTVVGPAGDNQAAAEWVEKMTLDVAATVSATLTARCEWARPAALPFAGGTYLTAELTVSTDIEPD